MDFLFVFLLIVSAVTLVIWLNKKSKTSTSDISIEKEPDTIEPSQCNHPEFKYDSYHDEYVCKKCGWTVKEKPRNYIDQNETNSRASEITTDLFSEIEDVRSNSVEDGEIILNLWYVTNGIVIKSLRAKKYVASGSDEDMLSFLRMRANHDFQDAQVYEVPENLKVDVKLVDGSTEVGAGKACTHDFLEIMGGFPALFREIISNVPNGSFRFDPTQAMMCVTALVKGQDGELKVRIDNTEKL